MLRHTYARPRLHGGQRKEFKLARLYRQKEKKLGTGTYVVYLSSADYEIISDRDN